MRLRKWLTPQAKSQITPSIDLVTYQQLVANLRVCKEITLHYLPIIPPPVLLKRLHIMSMHAPERIGYEMLFLVIYLQPLR